LEEKLRYFVNITPYGNIFVKNNDTGDSQFLKNIDQLTEYIKTSEQQINSAQVNEPTKEDLNE
jgi:predicted RND superfamily exporter protein